MCLEYADDTPVKELDHSPHQKCLYYNTKLHLYSKLDYDSSSGVLGSVKYHSLP